MREQDPVRDADAIQRAATSQGGPVPRLPDSRPPEDWWAIGIGMTLLLLSLCATGMTQPSLAESLMADNPIAPWFDKPAAWSHSPLDALLHRNQPGAIQGLAGAFLVGLLCFGLAAACTGTPWRTFAAAFLFVFLLAAMAYIVAEHRLARRYHLEFALWALVGGLLVSNTSGVPRWVRPALHTELYIKTGLVLLGGEILLGKLLTLGLPGVFIAWIVTPVVLVSTYAFGQRVLRMESKSLNMTLSADMSVCGVSAAIAVAAACKAKREELSLAIGISMAFTVVMMVAMPAVVEAVGMDQVVAGAWIGGTIDSTGAVAAAGGMVGDTALQVATVVKMIQNVMIGGVAFAVATYWVLAVEPQAGGPRPRLAELWTRFPKFVLGFLGASAAFTALEATLPSGAPLVTAATDATRNLRGWFFCLAFVSIGLETNVRELARFMKGGKPIALYVCGQALNLLLTFLSAWVVFNLAFPQARASFAP